jgi:hypothetical protein
MVRRHVYDSSIPNTTGFRYPPTLAISTDTIGTPKTNPSFHKTTNFLGLFVQDPG